MNNIKILVRKRVTAGIKKLNSSGEVPRTWFTKISLKKLDMSCLDNCVLGQLFSKEKCCHTLDFRSGFGIGSDKLRIDIVQCGFDYDVASTYNYEEYYKELETEWVRQIKQLRREYRLTLCR